MSASEVVREGSEDFLGRVGIDSSTKEMEGAAISSGSPLGSFSRISGDL